MYAYLFAALPELGFTSSLRPQIHNIKSNGDFLRLDPDYIPSVGNDLLLYTTKFNDGIDPKKRSICFARYLRARCYDVRFGGQYGAAIILEEERNSGLLIYDILKYLCSLFDSILINDGKNVPKFKEGIKTLDIIEIGGHFILEKFDEYTQPRAHLPFRGTDAKEDLFYELQSKEDSSMFFDLCQTGDELSITQQEIQPFRYIYASSDPILQKRIKGKVTYRPFKQLNSEEEIIHRQLEEKVKQSIIKIDKDNTTAINHQLEEKFTQLKTELKTELEEKVKQSIIKIDKDNTTAINHQLEEKFTQLKTELKTELEEKVKQSIIKIDKDNTTAINHQLEEKFTQLKTELKTELEEKVKQSIIKIDKDNTTAINHQLEEKFTQLKTELKTEFTELKTQLKTEFTELKTQLKTEFTELKTQLKTEKDKKQDKIKIQDTCPKPDNKIFYKKPIPGRNTTN